MRDKRFIAEHRGGILTKSQHRQIISWACICAEHVMLIVPEEILDSRLKSALSVARAWEKQEASVGEARKASLAAIAVANEASSPVITALARSVGHAVAAAHMADHSLGAVLYALKAVRFADRSIDEERTWQNDQLPPEIRELILAARERKEQALNAD
jgi:hypothetical protein